MFLLLKEKEMPLHYAQMKKRGLLHPKVTPPIEQKTEVTSKEQIAVREALHARRKAIRLQHHD